MFNLQARTKRYLITIIQPYCHMLLGLWIINNWMQNHHFSYQYLQLLVKNLFVITSLVYSNSDLGYLNGVITEIPR